MSVFSVGEGRRCATRRLLLSQQGVRERCCWSQIVSYLLSTVRVLYGFSQIRTDFTGNVACMYAGSHARAKHSNVVVSVWKSLAGVLVFVQIFLSLREKFFPFSASFFFPPPFSLRARDLLFLFFSPGDDDDVHYLSDATEEKYARIAGGSQTKNRGK